MEDYGMCCGPNEARQCTQEWYARLELERQQERINDLKLMLKICVTVLIAVGMAILFTNI